MSSGPLSPEPARTERLESWKEIAEYLGREVRTVQIWEKELGLPVHRMPHKKRGAVYAYKAEVDAWRQAANANRATAAEPAIEASPGQSSLAPSPPRRRVRMARLGLAAGSVALVALVLLGWHMLLVKPAVAHAVLLTGRYFAAATRQGGHVRWLPVDSGSHILALSPDGQKLFAAASGSIEEISVANRVAARRWTMEPPIGALTLSSDGRHLFALTGESNLSVLDTASGAVRSLGLDGPAVGMAIAPDGRYLYVAQPYGGIDRVDTANLQVEHWSVPPCPEQLAVTPDGRRLYVSFQCGGPGGYAGHDALGIFDAETGALVTDLAGPPRVGTAIALTPDGNEVWADGGGACAEPKFDHRGCPFVPAGLVQIFSSGNLQLLKTVAMAGAQTGQQVGGIVMLPGGERVLDGSIILSSARFSRLEALPPTFSGIGFGAVSRDGSHLYLPVSHGETSAIADFSPTSSACAPPTLNLEDWWPGDGSADDAWGIVNGHTDANVRFMRGEVGQAFDLSRLGAAVALGPDPSLDFRFENHTLAAWVKLSAPGPAAIFDKMTADARTGWRLDQTADGRTTFCLGSAAAQHPDCLTSKTALGPNSWHHIAVAAGASSATLYVDGRQEARAQLDSTFSRARGTALLVGADRERHQYLGGAVDEIMLYSRALSPVELQALIRMPACIAAGSKR